MNQVRRFLTPEETAAHCGVTTGTLLSWSRAGIIPVIKITPKTLRFDLTEVEAALRLKTQPPRAPEAQPRA
jgi:predicted site-specific integrase-resolvase